MTAFDNSTMSISRSTINARAASVRSALSRADRNRDGKLSASERTRAVGMVKGAADDAIRESFKQARTGNGFVSVSRARSLVALANRRALAVDKNRNGVSGNERAKNNGPIFRALTQGAGGTTTGGTGGTGGTTGGATFGAKAKRLAAAARNVASRMNTSGWCARGVNRALRAAGLPMAPSPSAYMYARRLASDSRFREIRNVSDAGLRKLPPGAVVVFAPNGGRTRHGHIMVTVGGGREASDHIQRVSVHGTQRVFVPR